MELSVKEYLDSVPNPSTKKEYRLGIRKFCEWFGKSPEEILEMRKDDLTQTQGENLIDYRNRVARFEKEIEKFHSYLIEQGYKTNTCRTVTLGIRQLFRYYRMPVQIRTGSRVNKTVKTSKNFPLRIEHVREMFKFADLKGKVVLSLAVDLGLRIGDFIQIKKASLPSLEDEPPISFVIMTDKEEVLAYGFLSDETVSLLRLYLPTLKSENAYLFPSNGKTHVSDEWLNRLLKKLASKAQIEMNGKSLTFHCFRKMFLSTCIDSGVGLTAGKKLCGKAIAQSDDTYLTNVKLREKFIQLKRFLTIQEQPKPQDQEKLRALQNVVASLQEELTKQKLITETMTQESLNIKKDVKELKSMLSVLMGPGTPKLEELKRIAEEKRKITEEARKHDLVTDLP